MFKPLSATANRAVRKHEIAHLADVHRRRTTNPPRTLDTSTPDSAKYARQGNPKRLQQLYMRELEIERQNRILRSRIEHVGGGSRPAPVQSRRRRKGKLTSSRAGPPAPLASVSAPPLPSEDDGGASGGDGRSTGEKHRVEASSAGASRGGGPRVRIVVSSDGEELEQESYPLQSDDWRAGPAEGTRARPISSHRRGGPHSGHTTSPGAKDLSFSDLHLLRMSRRREQEQERRQEENARLLHRLDRVRPVYSRERWRESMATHEHFRKLRQQQPTPQGMYENAHPRANGSSSSRRASAVQIVVQSADNDCIDVHTQAIPQSPEPDGSGEPAPGADSASPHYGPGEGGPEEGNSGGGSGLPDGILGEVRRDGEGRIFVLDSSGGPVVGGSDQPSLMAAAAALASATGSDAAWAAGSSSSAGQRGGARGARSRRKRPGLRSSHSADAKAYEALVRGASRTPHPARLIAKGPSARQEAHRLEEQRRWLERHRTGSRAGRRGGRSEQHDGSSVPSRLARPQGPWLCGSCDHLNSAATMNCLLCGALFMRAGRDEAAASGTAPAPTSNAGRDRGSPGEGAEPPRGDGDGRSAKTEQRGAGERGEEEEGEKSDAVAERDEGEEAGNGAAVGEMEREGGDAAEERKEEEGDTAAEEQKEDDARVEKRAGGDAAAADQEDGERSGAAAEYQREGDDAAAGKEEVGNGAAAERQDEGDAAVNEQGGAAEEQEEEEGDSAAQRQDEGDAAEERVAGGTTTGEEQDEGPGGGEGASTEGGGGEREGQGDDAGSEGDDKKARAGGDGDGSTHDVAGAEEDGVTGAGENVEEGEQEERVDGPARGGDGTGQNEGEEKIGDGGGNSAGTGHSAGTEEEASKAGPTQPDSQEGEEERAGPDATATAAPPAHDV